MPFPTRMIEHVRPQRKRDEDRRRSIEHRCKAIADVVLFQPLSAEQIKAVSTGATDVLLGPGQVLFHQGEGGDSLFIVRRGEVEVLAGDDGPGRHRIATLGRGDFFGEMSALTGQPRSATIRALTDLCVVEIGKDDLASIFAADPSIMEKMSQIVVDRNLARTAALTDAAAATAAQKVSQQTSMLQRMRSFFGRGRE
jgi:CRP-like cAMP-binding protein